MACLAMAGCTASPLPTAASLQGEGLGAYYRDHGGVEATSDHAIEFYDGGPAIKAGMLNLIEEAEDHVLVDSFLLTDGTESGDVIDALEERRRYGLNVQLIGDGSSRFVPEPHAFDRLAEQGIAGAEFNPYRGLRLAWLPSLLERDHRKFWIADDHVLFLGGANLNELSLLPPEKGGNLDLMVRIDSPDAACAMRNSFVKTWNSCRDASPSEITGLVGLEYTNASPEGKRFWLFNQEELRGTSSMTEDMFDGLFGAAKESVWLIHPYTLVNPHIISRVREMSARGVKVNLVLSTQCQGPRFHCASYYGIKDLIDAGAQVWRFESSTTPLHYKCILVDNRLACVGSSNFNYRSFRLAREVNVVFEDPPAVAEVRRVVDSVRSGSVAVTREEAKRYRTPRYFAWWLLMQLGG